MEPIGSVFGDGRLHRPTVKLLERNLVYRLLVQMEVYGRIGMRSVVSDDQHEIVISDMSSMPLSRPVSAVSAWLMRIPDETFDSVISRMGDHSSVLSAVRPINFGTLVESSVR